MFFSLLIGCILIGCQDVIEVEVPIDEPRLVIDGLIRLNDTESLTTLVQIKANVTSSFFENIQPVKLDGILLLNLESGNSETLSEISSGIYQKSVPTKLLTEGELLLLIQYNDQEYQATTTYVPAVPIDNLTQGTNTLFTGDETEIVVSFTDAPDRVDFYLFDFGFDEYLVSEDTFYLGQSFEFSYFYDGELRTGTELNISILGVDEPFYNYMTQLIVQSGGDQGPFQTPAATVKGNIVNSTDPDNFALGYFAVSQTYTSTLEIVEK